MGVDAYKKAQIDTNSPTRLFLQSINYVILNLNKMKTSMTETDDFCEHFYKIDVYKANTIEKILHLHACLGTADVSSDAKELYDTLSELFGWSLIELTNFDESKSIEIIDEILYVFNNLKSGFEQLKTESM